MSIYKQVLGNQLSQLHPMLQKRYEFPFSGKGTMSKIKGGPWWLYPLLKWGVKWKLLFPEKGHDIPFTIKNTSKIGKQGEPQVHWERVFYFGAKKRYFNALMSLDQERNIIKDYLGEPPVFYSDLSFTISPEGDLTIKSVRQRFVLGRFEIPVLKIFQGLATVTEKYLETTGTYSIHVVVNNPLIGRVFSYEGEFVSDDFAKNWDR